MKSWITFALILVIYGFQSSLLDAASDLQYTQFDIHMPGVRPQMKNDFICTAKQVQHDQTYIVQFIPHANATWVHHLLLFGCSRIYSESHLYPGSWNCAHGNLCDGMTLLYAWAKNVPTVILPKDVGMKVSQDSAVRYLVLQISYGNLIPEGETDTSGLLLHMTSIPQKYIAGIHLMMSSTIFIPPHKPKFHVDVNCALEGSQPIYPFAYRVHTHQLGVVVTGYNYNVRNNTWSLLVKGNPQWPQSFYPMDRIYEVNPDDILAARCTYNSTNRANVTLTGSTSSDEMCNLYLMYYTSAIHGRSYSRCSDIQDKSLSSYLPEGNDTPLPFNSLLDSAGSENHGSANSQRNFGHTQAWNQTLPHFSVTKKGHGLKSSLYSPDSSTRQFDEALTTDGVHPHLRYKPVSGWPENRTFGQVTGIDIDSKGNIVVFHRGSHVWNAMTFDPYNVYLLIGDGPVSDSPIVALDLNTGHVLYAWGKNMFYMPHGLTIDKMGFIWLTDVAMHQIFKFPETGSPDPLLTIGERFVPGSDEKHFCKPTSVAISTNGDIYVADGYCNSRIIRFSASGQFLNQWGNPSPFDPAPPNTFKIPHKVVIAEDKDLICAADRENGRIQCFSLVDGRFIFQIYKKEFGGRLFSVAYSKAKGGLLYAVSGPDLYGQNVDVHGFVINITDQQLISAFYPAVGSFSQPHDVAVTQDTNYAFVVEIGPNKVWKFSRGVHKSAKKVLNVSQPPPLLPTISEHTVVNHSEKANIKAAINETKAVDEEATNFGASIIILALIALPILAFILATVVIRLQKRGKLQQCSMGHVKGWLGGYKAPAAQDKFNLGRLLNPHKGFDQVALDESDIDAEGSSGSDVEEFSVTARKA